MSLTVPRAGVVAGASTTVQVAQPETANIIAEFGNRMQQHGMAWADKQRQRLVQRQQLDMTRDYGLARIEAERLTDPAEIGAFWDAKNAELDEKYVAGQTDPEVASALGIARQETADRHTIGLAGRQVELERSQQEADWIEASQIIVTEAVTADPDTLAMLIEQGEARIDGSELDPAEKAKRKQALRETVFTTRAKAMVDRDPAGFLAAVEAGEYAELGENRETLTVAAENELARLAAKEATAAEAAMRERDTALGKELDTIASLAGDGRVVANADFANSPEVAAAAARNPDLKLKLDTAQAAIGLQNEFHGLKLMSVTDLDRLIALEEKKPLTEKYQAERLNVLRKYREDAATARAADPLPQLKLAGHAVPDLPAFEADEAQIWASGLSRRISFDDYAQNKGLAGTQAMFSKEDKAQLKAVMDPKADPSTKLSLAAAITAGSGGKTKEVLAAMEADPVFAQAVKMLGQTGDRDLAMGMLSGQQKIAAGTVILPAKKEMTLIIDQATAGVFADDPLQAEAVRETALALYANDAAGIDAETQSSEGFIREGAAYTALTSAIARSMGASADRSGNLTIGGLQEVNGAPVILPSGVSQADADQMFENLTMQLRGANWDATTFNGQGDWSFSEDFDDSADSRLRAFTAASPYGIGPDLGANPDSMLSGLTMRRVGDSEFYEFVLPRGGRLTPVPLNDGSGRAYRFRLKDLMREAGK